MVVEEEVGLDPPYGVTGHVRGQHKRLVERRDVVRNNFV